MSLLLQATECWAKFKALTEKELVAAAVDFANDAKPDIALKLVGGMHLPGLATLDPDVFSLTLQVSASSLEADQAKLRTGLNHVVNGTVSSDYKTALIFLGDGMVMLPRRRFENGRLRIEYGHVAESLWAVLSFVLLLLLDKSKPYGKNLCRCKLESCGKFFFAKRPKNNVGNTIRGYHSAACADKGEKLLMAQRVARFRQQKRKAVKKRRSR